MMVEPDEVFTDLLAALRWGAELDLSERSEVRSLCFKIAGVSK